MTTRRNARASTGSRTRTPKVRSARLRGRGDYSADILEEPDLARRLEKKIDHLEKSLVHATPSIKSGAGMAGRALGSLLGQGDLGALAGESLAKLFGYGDYSARIKGNSLMAGVAGNSVPKFQGDGKRGVRLMEREFLGNVTAGSLVSGSTTFTNTAYNLNPTDPATFPWLSKIAQLFDQWEPHGIVFEFHTTSSTFNGSSQALGAVVMATDYDFNDANYSSKQVMENADYACSSVPSNNLLHGVECDPHERPLDVMYTTVRAATPNFSSLGKFQIATQGMSVANVVVGELWVSYDITFYKKQLAASTADIPWIGGTGSSAIGTPIFNPNVTFGSYQMTSTVIIGTGTDVFFPPAQDSGKYIMVASTDNYQVGDSAAFDPTAGAVNCSVISAAVPSLTVGGSEIFRYFIQINAPGAKIRLGLKNTVGGNQKVHITQVPDTLPFV